jgi:hypothetical protein
VTREIETVGDLEADREVYYASHSSGPVPPVHLDNDCRFLEHAKNQFSGTALQLHSDRPVCKECTGAADYGQPHGGDVAATRCHLLSELEPDDVGLSALGERPGGG